MSEPFSRSMRSLRADGFRLTLGILAFAGLFLFLWGLWFFFATVSLYAVTDIARLEVEKLAHPVEAPIAGRVVATELRLGRDVRQGDLLVELDSQKVRFQLEEVGARRAGISSQLDTLRKELQAQNQALRQARQAESSALDEARAEQQEAEAAARLAEEDAGRVVRLHDQGLVSDAEQKRAAAAAEQRRAAARAKQQSLKRMELDRRLEQSEKLALLAELERQADVLQGDLSTLDATRSRLEYELELHRISAPVSGHLGEMVPLQVGSFVDEGDQLAAVVPPGEIRVVAEFAPSEALGRIRPEQRGTLRLKGFPWISYGTVPATVARVADETQNGKIRVEASVRPLIRLPSSPPARLAWNPGGGSGKALPRFPRLAFRGTGTFSPHGRTWLGGEPQRDSMRVTGRRFFVPEIVQSSAMDCGPAALKALLDGHGIPVSYGRLREVCQTDVDGTSIDTLEEVAFGLGLEAEQIMVPVDHVLLPEANALPAIAVVQLPNGNTHFIVVWSRHLGWVQIMDPGFGRHWVPRSRFLSELYQHGMPVPAADWREWAGSDEAIATLRRRISNLRISDDTVNGLVETSSVPSWYPLACLDASTRAADAMVRSGAIRTGREAARALESLYKQARENESDPGSAIPTDYWSVRAATAGPDNNDEEERVHLRGAVLVRARGRRPTPTGTETPSEDEALSPDLESVLEVEPVRPLREIFRFLKADGLLAPTALIGALLGASMGVLIEALLFRNLLELGPELGVSGQRLGAFGALILLLILLLCIEIPIATGEYRLGRRLEARLRMAFQRKIPLLADRYFRSRLTSDMAERNHSVHTLRTLPKLGSNFIRRVFEMLLTVVGIIWLDPPSAAPALSVAAVALGIPLATMSLLEERELRVRTHVGALSRFYLDALLGLIPVFAHSAGQAIRSEHEGLLTEWARSRLSLMRGILAVEAVPAFLGFGLSAWLLLGHLGRGGELGVVLLLAYWALNLPVLGLEIAWLAWQYPTRHNIMLRFLEPLGAPEEIVAGTKPGESVTATGAAIQIQNVTVRSGGHVVLREIDLALEAGDHVAVVGASGTGKTSLFGLLLGWHRPAIGNVRVDGEALEAERLSRTRAETAWVDPAIQIWNRSLLENLQYGSADAAPRLPSVVDQAELRSVLEKLPEGYQTKLGEGGGLVSGGEGQRVRLGRALLRPGTRLVLLDEPFRGLARAQRRDLLRRARSFWNEATLLCVTHDIAETRLFDRVLVMEGGTIVEDGAPSELEARAESRYRSLLSSEEKLRQLWAEPSWRRWRLEEGRIRETAP